MIAGPLPTVARPDGDLWFLFSNDRVTFGWGLVPPSPHWDKLAKVELRGPFGMDDKCPAVFFGERTVVVAPISAATWAGLEEKYKA